MKHRTFTNSQKATLCFAHSACYFCIILCRNGWTTKFACRVCHLYERMSGRARARPSVYYARVNNTDFGRFASIFAAQQCSDRFRCANALYSCVYGQLIWSLIATMSLSLTLFFFVLSSQPCQSWRLDMICMYNHTQHFTLGHFRPHRTECQRKCFHSLWLLECSVFRLLIFRSFIRSFAFKVALFCRSFCFACCVCAFSCSLHPVCWKGPISFDDADLCIRNGFATVLCGDWNEKLLYSRQQSNCFWILPWFLRAAGPAVIICNSCIIAIFYACE